MNELALALFAAATDAHVVGEPRSVRFAAFKERFDAPAELERLRTLGFRFLARSDPRPHGEEDERGGRDDRVGHGPLSPGLQGEGGHGDGRRARGGEHRAALPPHTGKACRRNDVHDPREEERDRHHPAVRGRDRGQRADRLAHRIEVRGLDGLGEAPAADEEHGRGDRGQQRGAWVPVVAVRALAHHEQLYARSRPSRTTGSTDVACAS